ncbi:uncharacterized protein PV06_07991 [Exophiala oligosperma]|uniref:Uncharacterized protein n=1 Tax=Exophiala oligosperma TaxID=215243 RepID=A0A0D2DZ17_9EURO|nr:uncharacterized protein PV06_07991 [Exophiala oligosperma]KIW40819.1 hypothetical protein PV06_07991 [Exophiala oligosperma]
MWRFGNRNNNPGVSPEDSSIGEKAEPANETGLGGDVQDVSKPTKDGDGYEDEDEVRAMPQEQDTHATSSVDMDATDSHTGIGLDPASEGSPPEQKAVEERGSAIEAVYPATSASSAKPQSTTRDGNMADSALALTDQETHQDVTEKPTPGSLDAAWRQLSGTVDSYTAALITTGDVRRGALEKRKSVVHQLDTLMSSPELSLTTDLRQALLDLQTTERKLEEKDDFLIQQGYQITYRGSRIFGPLAESSLDFLRQQDVTVLSVRADTEGGSEVSQNDIRHDQTVEARLFLSKKGDIDLLLENLMELEEGEFPAGDEGVPETDDSTMLKSLETRKRDLMRQLEEAEEELLTLWEKLPDRPEDIPEDQLRSSVEGQEETPAADDGSPEGQGVEESNQDPENENRLVPGDRRHRFRQILDSVTDGGGGGGGSVRPDTLVNAYLLHQLRSSPEEQAAYVEAIKEVVESTGVPLRTDLESFAIRDWFEDVPRFKSRSSRRGKPAARARRWTSSRNDETSLAVHSNRTQATRGRSEPHVRQKRPRPRPRARSRASAGHDDDDDAGSTRRKPNFGRQ